MNVPELFAAIQVRKAHLDTVGIQPLALVVGWQTWHLIGEHEARVRVEPHVEIPKHPINRTYYCGMPVVIDSICKLGEFWIAV